MKIAIVTFRRNVSEARRIQGWIGGEILFYHPGVFREAFNKADAVVAIMALGIVVRGIAPLLRGKWSDPPVVVVDAGMRFAIPVVGGHHGANTLARRLAPLGVIPVITTATDSLGRQSVEGIAETLGAEIVNRDSTKKVNLAMLEEDVEVLEVRGPKVLVVDESVSVLVRKGVVVGIGARKGVETVEVVQAVNSALQEVGLDLGEVSVLATAEVKQKETGILEAASLLGKRVVFVPAEVIKNNPGPTKSEAGRLGLPGICEPAALTLSQGRELLMPKKSYGRVTVAIAR